MIIKINGRSVKNKPTEPVFTYIGLSKAKYIKTLVKSYRLLGFKDFNILELALLSQKQWLRREYPVPEGYEVRYGHGFNYSNRDQTNWNFRKKTPKDLFML